MMTKNEVFAFFFNECEVPAWGANLRIYGRSIAYDQTMW